jgi:fermentation-respiration switch protein FrsA (DUF1100 family)
VRRRRLLAGAVLLAIIAGVTATIVAASQSSGPTSTGATPPGPRPPPSAARPPFPVGTFTFTVTEPAGGSSTGSAPGAVTAARTLDVTVRYPAESGSRTTQAPATPARTSGPFPLVVFSGGYGVSPEEYGTLLDAWTAAGFVVADPAYPFTTPTSPGGLDESDIVNHPGDLTAVITALLDAGGGAGGQTTPPGAAIAAGGPLSTLSNMIDPGEIAAIGHSDGGDVTLAAVAGSCCRDARIRSAAVLSGAEDAAFGGTYFAGTGQVPLLVIQGTDDDINPEGCSVQLYDQAPAPKRYLSLVGESHQGPYLDAGTAQTIVQRVTTDFLDWTLKGSVAAVTAMSTDGNVAGSSALSTGAAVALAAGPCPGAPGN